MSGLDGLGWPTDCAECDRLKMLLAAVYYFEEIKGTTLKESIFDALGNPSAVELFEMIRMMKLSNKP